MRRNCNLELRLVPPSAALHSEDYVDDNHHYHLQPMLDLLSGSPGERQQQQRQLTIFYNGRVRVSEVTELEARSVIMLASREMEEKMKSLLGNSEPSSPFPQSPILCSSSSSPPSTGLSMKRSLQRFLQKRKNRIQATSPYSR